MPVYQQQAFVADAVQSVLAQRDVAAEIILSDDASRDETFSVARNCVLDHLKQQATPHRIILRQGGERLRRDHLPLLLDYASCDVVFQAHGDDTSHRDRARILLRLFNEHAEVTMIACNSTDLQPEEHARVNQFKLVPTFKARPYSMEQILKGDKTLIGFAQAWRRGAQAGFVRLDSNLAPASHDRITAFRAGLAGKVLFVDAPLINRRLHSNSWSANMAAGQNRKSVEFGWSLVRLNAIDVMAGDVLHAGKIGLIDQQNCQRLMARIATLQRACKTKMFQTYRELTRQGMRMNWLSD